MSIEALTWALKVKLDPSGKLVLLVLANYANHDDEAWPAIATLIDVTGLSRATLIRKLADLEAAGLITKQRRVRPGGQTTNLYRLPGVSPCDPGVSPRDPGGVSPRDGGGVMVRPPEPSVNPPTPLPAGWVPDPAAVEEMRRRYPELDLEACTDAFASHFGGTDKTNPNWLGRWKRWVSEDARRPRERPLRSTAPATRADRVREHNRRAVDNTLARLAAFVPDGPEGD